MASGKKESVEMIRKNLQISIKAHSSKLIAIVGHFDCAGNPVDEKTHIENIQKCIELISSWGHEAEVIGLWVDKTWNVKHVK